MTPGEFLEWKTFYEIRPFGDEFNDLRFAYQTGNIVSMLTKVDDWGCFMTPILGRPKAEKPGQSNESFELEMLKIRRAMGNV